MSVSTGKIQPVGSLSQWQLIQNRFLEHKLAVAALLCLCVLYTLAVFAEFFAPYRSQRKDVTFVYAPPQSIRFSLHHGFHTYALERKVDEVTLKRVYIRRDDAPVPLAFFTKGEPYKMWGFIPAERRFFGIDLAEYHDNMGDDAPVPTLYILGADKYGRDILSRIIYGARISLSVGLVAILIIFLLGVTIGGISGYMGGQTDNLIQRFIEILNSFPHLPLWLGLSAAVPPDWSPLRTYFAITIVLSLLSWTALARVVRGKVLSLREEDYAVAARLLGASHSRVIFRHLIPGFTSHIIVTVTLAIPGMIIGETALSFLGLGLKPPVVSWGVMLQECMNMDVLSNYPWVLASAAFIVITVLSFNFVGDGLRDAADPYAGR